ncbi:HpcH/HpaI aldolase family protein [Jannaschia sp. CCS1]|uniref:HpcH/HpaI aldolase family protein n=1 Tax=Jannaschia sp. (strain CCS1) TaxID=290400 RepID=UPI00006C0094|nr:aldolase/citrate lyase family protein [Jannaschia sp. CCS1]ABD55996.1 HpcH/HpaI aldolase [Jannaschia sp. CCS1]
MTRDLGALLASPSRTIGTWSQIAAPEMIDLIGLNGFDFTVIDCEHGVFGMDAAENLARAADANDIAAAVRVPQNDPVLIMKALDAGIRHVVVPNLSSGEEAARAVAATRFAPHGLRGACPCCRSGGHFIRNWQDYVVEEEARVGVIGLVETANGYRNIKEICATPGLRGLMFGPFDLSVSMGFNGDWRHDTVQAALVEMVTCALGADLDVMMPIFSADSTECETLIADWSERGVRSFVIGSDKILIATAFAQWSGVARSAT